MKNIQFKRILTLFLLATVFLSILPSTAIAVGNEKIDIEFASPAIPCDSGEKVDLSRYGVCFTKDGSPVYDIDWSSSELNVSCNTVTAPKAGVYIMTAKSKDLEKKIYLVAKNPFDTEYVLYENHFDNADGLKVVASSSGTSWKAVDGKLILDASQATGKTVLIAMPDWLSDFGDYKITADLTMSKAVNEKRWASLVFRLQKSPSLYYQMAIRSNATLKNGIEIAEHTSSGWNVTHTAAYSEKLSSSKSYRLEAQVKGKSAAVFVDGTLMAYSETVSSHLDGRLGLQVNACKAEFSSYKVTLMTDGIKVSSKTDYADVENPDSGITLAPTVITNGSSDLAATAKSGASAAIYEVDSSLTVTTGGKLEDVINRLKNKLIPIFKVDGKDAAVAVANELKRLKHSDAFIISSDEEALLAARSVNTSIMGALDFSSAKNPELAHIREAANRAMCRVVILSKDQATRENVDALQQMFTTVWVIGGGSPSDHAKSVTSGAHGVITDDVKGLLSFMKEHFPENSVVRTVQIIAHRGVPELYQENSLEGAKKAYELGATMIENDVHMTSDGVIVVMHDETVDRTTPGSGAISSMTYEQLSKLTLDGKAGLASQPIPTLEDYFKEFKGKDVKIVVEIKSKDTRIAQSLAELVDKYDILDQINFITFDTAQNKALKKYIPGAPCGYLCSSLTIIDADSTYSAEQILKMVQPFNSTFNPSYTKGLGRMTMKALNHRGITVWPYTVNSKSDLTDMFLFGLSGITTNYSDWMTDVFKSVSTEDEINFMEGESAGVKVNATTYGRKTETVSAPEYMLIEGNSSLKYENGVLTATKPGIATVMFRVKAELPDGTEFYLYTEPVSVNVTSKTPAETKPDTEITESSTSTTPNETDFESKNKTGCGRTSLSLLLAVVPTLAVSYIFGKKH